MLDDPRRQTGRTTDMLRNAALVKAVHGRVTIVVAYHAHVTYCLNMWRDHAARNDLPMSLTRRDFVTINDVRRGSLRGLQARVFVDHYVWEELVRQDRDRYMAWIGDGKDPELFAWYTDELNAELRVISERERAS